MKLLVVVLLFGAAAAFQKQETRLQQAVGCRDLQENCDEWRYLCDYEYYGDHMRNQCAKTCGFCREPTTTSTVPPTTEFITHDPPFVTTPTPTTVDPTNEADCTLPDSVFCHEYIQDCEDEDFIEHLIKFCPRTCGFCQEADTTITPTTEVAIPVDSSFNTETTVAPANKAVCTVPDWEICGDYIDHCQNPYSIEIMIKNCPRMCGFCQQADATVTPTPESFSTDLSTTAARTTVTTPQTTEAASGECVDQFGGCDMLVDSCSDPRWKDMLASECPKTCGLCADPTTTDAPTATEQATIGECTTEDLDTCPLFAFLCADPEWKDLMTTECPKTCGFCREAPTTHAPTTTAPPCSDNWASCPYLKDYCLEPNDKATLSRNCAKTCGLC